MAKNELRLNSVYLKNRMIELGLKQWWLAEQITVDRKTISRWVHGQVLFIQIENVEKLARILDCTAEDLTLAAGADQFATDEDQRKAAQALLSSSMIEKLGPIGEWDIIESLIKAAIVPNLPLQVLGELYDQLTIASWRQSKIDQAAEYNHLTENLAQRIQDHSLLASALLSKANIFSWRGQVADSIRAYQQCLTLEKYIEPRLVGSVYSNLGGVLYECGNLVAGEAAVRKSIEIFSQENAPLNLSISHTHLALIFLQRLQIVEADQEIATINQYAKEADYRRGLIFAKLLEGETQAHQKNHPKAIHCIETALQEFSEMKIQEGLNFEIASRSFRLLKDFAKAKSLAEKGISVSLKFPIYRAALHFELAMTLELMGDMSSKVQAALAIEIYEKHDCPLRAEIVKKRFQFK